MIYQQFLISGCYAQVNSMKLFLFIFVVICFIGCSGHNSLTQELYTTEEVKQLQRLTHFIKKELTKNCELETNDCITNFFIHFQNIGANEEFDIPISKTGEQELLNSIDSELFDDIWKRCIWERHIGRDSVINVELLCLNPEGRFTKLLMDARTKYSNLENYGQYFEFTKDFTPAMNSALLKNPKTFELDSEDQFLIMSIHLLTLNYTERIK